MSSKQFETVGDWPELNNNVLEALIVQEFWHEGELEDAANLTWLKVNGEWHDLCFEPGIIFWRKNWTNPFPLDEADGDAGFYYPRRDLGKEHALVGTKIISCNGGVNDTSTWVELGLEDFGLITFRHLDEPDSTFINLTTETLG